MKIGFLGAGHISAKMADTVVRLNDPGIKAYAVGARNLGRAQAFAARFDVPKSYGSYEELVADPGVDLIYVGTVNNLHLAHSRLAIEAGKPVLCEKPFTSNAREAEELIALARSRGVFLCEAVWTRFMPFSFKIGELLESRAIGRPMYISANLCYAMEYKERVMKPEFAGGALLDVGVYCLNFARMYFGGDIVRTESSCAIGGTGVDMFENITLYWRGGQMASLQSGAQFCSSREAVVAGDDGYIVINNVNCPLSARIYKNFKQVAEYSAPAPRATGYEYELLSCKEALDRGWVEHPLMPHAESLAIMRQMDDLRKSWGVRYPAD